MQAQRVTEFRQAEEVRAPAPSRALLVATPFYKNEQLVRSLSESLFSCAEELRALDAKIVFYNDSPDYPELRAALKAASASAAVNVSVVENPTNLGFVRTMNIAFATALAEQRDLLILNSDTVVFPGALAEMVRVSRLDPMTGFVCPRSNNATICSLPRQGEFADVSPQEGFANYSALSGYLPDVSYVPTGVGFCMLIRWEIIAEFGAFDPIYGGGYNEENDLVSRAGRCGWRAVLANKAFVWHQGEQSFTVSDTPKVAREAANRAILLERYPEYERVTSWYDVSPDSVAEKVLGGLLPRPDGRVSVAFDFSSVGRFHNGTAEAGKRLLAQACRSWAETYDVAVIATPEAWAFHGLSENDGLRRVDMQSDEAFAAVIRVGQPYDWPAIERLARRAPAIVIYMLDTISLDCAQLHDPDVESMWGFVAEHSDVFLCNSVRSLRQYEARFSFSPTTIRRASLHSADVCEYVPNVCDATFGAEAQGAVYVVGNHFAHKYVGETVDALLAALPDVKVAAMGVDHDDPRAICFQAGELTDAQTASLYSRSQVVVFPSHYEGFGFPLMHALANHKPVFVRDLDVYQEILDAMGGSLNVYRFGATAELVAMLRAGLPAWRDEPVATGEGWARATDDLHKAVRDGIEQVSHAKITARLRALKPRADAAARALLPPPPAPPPPRSREQIAADYAGGLTRNIVYRVLHFRGAYRIGQAVLRAVRASWRRLRGLFR